MVHMITFGFTFKLLVMFIQIFDCCPVECETQWFGSSVPMFWKNLLPPSSGWMITKGGGLRFALQNIATAKLCGITSRKTKIVTFAAMKLDLQNSNRILGSSCFICSLYYSTAEILNSPATYPGWS